MSSQLWLEHRRSEDLLGIGESAPRISWVPFAKDGLYNLKFEYFDGTTHTSSSDGQTHLIEWPFPSLNSRDGGVLTVSDAQGTQERTIHVEAGLLRADDWKVSFVSPSASAPQGTLRPAFLVRAEFSLEDHVELDQIARVRAYVSAHGVYEVEMNGKKPTEEILAPGWTSYSTRLRYRTLDLTKYFSAGKNVIGFWLADGWYRGRIGFDGGLWDNYGPDVAVACQLEVTDKSGSVHLVDLEQKWEWTLSPITEVGLYEGETFDSRLICSHWSETTTKQLGWSPVSPLAKAANSPLVASDGPVVRETQLLKPVATSQLENGRVRLDFGQNIAGRVRIRVKGTSGETISIHHAEVLENGALGTRPLRTAISVDTYISDGEFRTWEPRFTIHGFRYVELENWPVDEPVIVEAVVIHSDMQRTGWFSSSNPDLNQLFENVVWSMRDNFVDLPTDCPQRDERMGWTGDIQVFAPTALFLFDSAGVLRSWLKDVANEQKSRGHVPNFVPWIECGFPDHPTAAWGDAAVIVPWRIYELTGDTQVLFDQYESMTGWVDLVHSLTGGTGLWNSGFQLGDWLDPAAPADFPSDARTDKYLVATAYHIHTADLLARTARMLGKETDALKYEEMAVKARQAFQSEFVTPQGRLSSDSTTAYSLALVFKLVESPAHVETAKARLIEQVRVSRHHISTGFVGTPIICQALVIAGALDDAYSLLLQRECPSWLYQVSMGATTIWERWDSMLPDGDINPGGMTSFNHYALGSVADFLRKSVAGLGEIDLTNSQVRIQPLPGGNLCNAAARYDSIFGVVSVAWERRNGEFTLDLEVPLGLSAEVNLPGAEEARIVGPGRYSFSTPFPESLAGELVAPREWFE